MFNAKGNDVAELEDWWLGFFLIDSYELILCILLGVELYVDLVEFVQFNKYS